MRPDSTFQRSSLSSTCVRLGIGLLTALLPLLTLSVALPRVDSALLEPRVIPSRTAALQAAGNLCIAPDNGSGTVRLPPAPCQYVAAPGHIMMILDGLPPGTTIEIDPVLHSYTFASSAPGGLLGGEVHTFEATLTMTMDGTGDLDGFVRILDMPVAVEIHTAPRTPGDPVQQFDADLFSLQGALAPGDPDFASLQVVAGSNFGLPSPGQTTLTQLPTGDFAVDSFFDVTYQISFAGAPGSILEGLSGTTYSTCRLEAVSSLDIDLTITKSLTPTTATPGDLILYTITFSNAGGTIATDVLITDTIPVTVTSTSVISTGVLITDTGLSPGYVWSVQDLYPRQGGVITVSGVLSNVLVESTFTNTVQIAATETETSLANNADAAAMSVYVQKAYLPLIPKGY